MQLPAPTASGSFIKTPFPHLLVYALERRLSGTFVLLRGAAPAATMLVVGGFPAKVRTEEPIHFLGDVMHELGMIDAAQLATSLEKMHDTSRLQGQILVELGALDAPRLDAGLRAQVERKVEHLFSLPGDTTFNYYDNLDLLDRFGGTPAAIDPFPVLWRGVRESPAWEHVDATLRRVGGALLRASGTAQFERFAFTAQEMAAIEALRQKPIRVVEITGALGPNIGQLLAYLLMIMKQVDLVDPGQVSPGLIAPPPPSPRQGPQAPPSSGQAFARVQLQRQTPRNPLIVEEVVAAASNDERASSPAIKVASPATVPEGFAPVGQPGGGAFGRTGEPVEPLVPLVPPNPAVPLDIGSLIVNTIQSSSAPPAMNPPSPPPPSNQGMPSVGPSSRPEPLAEAPTSLTSEQVTLKTKIIERAEQITSQDYFQMLGIDHDATSDQIQRAFFGLAKVWHPDRLPPALIDVKDACSKVFTYLTEAHATLTDAPRRHDYMVLLRDGGATPDDQAKIQAILEAATEFQKAEFLLKRSPSDTQAYEIVRRCVSLDGEQADYIATLAWLDAQRPEWLSREKTLEKCLILERCIQKNPNCERAYFYRGLLYKRAGEANKALKDFKKAADLNPRNLDAMREVRLHNMRGGASKPPPGTPSKGTSKPPEAERLGGLFGKLFKK